MSKLLKLSLILLSFIIFSSTVYAQDLIRDELVEQTLRNKEVKEVIVNTDYNYEDLECIPIKLQIMKKITTKKGIQEGDIIAFRVKQNVKYNNRVLLKQDTIIKGRIKAYITRGMNGIPAQIILDDFEIPGIDSRKIKGNFVKRGLNLTIMVLPIKWALTPIPFVGSFTNFIIGGNANISDKDTIILYYYPNWHK